MRHTRTLILGALVYTVSTFTLAVVWHVMLFETRYRQFGYFEGNPDFVLGLLTIVLQAIVLSALYPRVSLAGQGMARGLRYAAWVGAFFWTSHVLAFIAKQAVQDAALFVAMETAYLCLQFGIFGAAIGLIHRDGDARA